MDPFDYEVSSKLKTTAQNNIRFTEEEKKAVRRETQKTTATTNRFQPVYWTVLASAATLFLFLGYLFLTDSGPDTAHVMPTNAGEMSYTLADLEGIGFEIIDKEQLDETHRNYTIELTNNTEHHIVDAVFRMSHPIKIQDGVRSNTFRAESQLNTIQPGETLVFEMELPSGIFDSDLVDIDSEEMEFTGYLNKIKWENTFQIGRSNSVIEE